MDRRRDAAFAALIALPALLLAGLSLVSARAAFTTLGAEATLEEARLGQRPDAARLRAAADANLAAAPWFESARYRTVAASALSAASQAGAKIPDSEIERPIREALSTSPASPFNWSRLAWLRFRAGDTKAAAAAWQMSVLTGRYKPPIMQSRLELGLRLLPSQDHAFEEEVSDQILVAARTDANALALFASRFASQAIVRAALADDAEARTKYDAADKRVRDRILADMKRAKR